MTRRTVIITATITVLAVVAVAMVLVLRPRSAAVSIPGLPLLTIGEASPSFERNERGALRAAQVYLESTEDAPALGPQKASDAQRNMSTRAAGDRLAVDVERNLSDLLDVYPQVRIRVAPIESRVDPDGDGWRVSIWYVETYTLDDIVIDDWRTVTYTLQWERDQWLIDAIVSVRGPLPARTVHLEPTPAPQFEQLLEGYSDDRGR